MNPDQPDLQITDIVVDSISTGLTTVKNFFGVGTIEEMQDYLPVVAATRSASKDAHEQFILPLLTQLFEEFGVDPKDKEAVKPYLELTALAINDGLTILVQNMQRQMQMQQQNQAAIAAGRTDQVII